ncbi:hypothetical protein M9H77_16305 [Catharanthus roseus]|uniref:Uncharacterized protein n=1 Tax=Catharanthus roseus TaxID=4058 RepID=A0ACC0B1E7_CATRO|nr:hypothetical protein M9H77_16305 [Catharanthus roseus]
MKAYFVEAHPNFGKVPDRIKNMYYTEFRARRHTRRSRRWHSRTNYRTVVARGLGSTPTGLGFSLSGGARPLHSWTCMSYCISRRDSGSIYDQRVLGEAKYQEPKANAKCLHIETGSPILTDEQLMFEGLSVAAIRATFMVSAHSLQPSPQSAGKATAARHQFLRERRLWGYIQQAEDMFVGFMTSFASQCGVQLDTIPTLFLPFPLPDDDTSHPSSSSPPPPA